MKKQPNFSVYINKVLKQVRENTGISARALYTINEITKSLIIDITQCASQLAFSAGKKTIKAMAVKSATMLVLPPELAKMADSQGSHAVNRYNRLVSGDSGTTFKKNTSLAIKAGYTFSPSRVRALMRQHYGGRIAIGACIYLGAVVEYLVAELIEAVGISARARGHVRITNRDISLSLQSGSKLGQLVNEKKYIVGGGVRSPLSAQK